MQTLLLAHKRKRISGITLPLWWNYIYILTQPSQVFVTEARPRGLGYVM